MARSTARKRALNTLYEADEKGQDIPSLLAERIAEPGAQTPLPDYAIEIVRGVADEQVGINRALESHSTKWPLRRMAVVDRNILRIAAWEILFNDDVPDRVAIDEALGLAKTLSDDDSPAFIHGLLSALCDDKDTVLADIKTVHEVEAKEKAEREAADRRLNSPTAPGFLNSRGISGKGDGVPFETETVNDDSPTSVDADSQPETGENSSSEASEVPIPAAPDGDNNSMIV
ncbi:transcription antitermination factor NusB [Bifidobacterium sp. ESL0784]|uniref:transcription antitermination factor NusB n=1 Tax=Bifidobacterium sp. ESL0784 TaxID=2983231 RepID=UPI0023F62CB6|nr:transcription antitermination factor NusB [Bifidobacterium sp. ESL0784]MDF7641031.1 transcription antitermination factor NusB [Bifidobacterium sp. ESL0784]